MATLMRTLFEKVSMKLRNLSPAAIKEIIVIDDILCATLIFSIHEYREDVEKEKAWHKMQEKIEQTSEGSAK